MAKSTDLLVIQQIRRSEMLRTHRVESGQPSVNPVVTISRSMGSGGRIVAQKLAEHCGFSLWDRELLDAIAEESSFSRRVVEAYDERMIPEVERLAYAALGDHEMADFYYQRHLARAVAMIASIGNAVILGRGANFLLPTALNVRVDASFDQRVRNMLTYEDIDNAAAIAKLRHSDHERDVYIHKVFGRDRARDFRYDLSLWMDRLTAADAASMIETACRRIYQSVSSAT